MTHGTFAIRGRPRPNPQEAPISEKTSTAEIQVHLVRPGVARDYQLPASATLADLLRRSGVPTADQAVLVDGVTPEEALVLCDGAVVTIVPRPGDAARDEPWRATIPAFRDEDLSRENTEALKARCRSAAPEEDPSASSSSTPTP